MVQALDPAQNVGRARLRWRIWFVRILAVLVAIPVVLAIAGATWQAVATADDRRAYPAPGALVAVGGYRMHLFYEGPGSPIVILDAANMGTVSNWAWIQPRLAPGAHDPGCRVRIFENGSPQRCHSLPAVRSPHPMRRIYP